jgi:hypothetical protein
MTAALISNKDALLVIIRPLSLVIQCGLMCWGESMKRVESSRRCLPSSANPGPRLTPLYLVGPLATVAEEAVFSIHNEVATGVRFVLHTTGRQWQRFSFKPSTAAPIAAAGLFIHECTQRARLHCLRCIIVLPVAVRERCRTPVDCRIQRHSNPQLMQAQACEARTGRYHNLIHNDRMTPLRASRRVGHAHAAANLFSLRDLNSCFKVASQTLAALRN